MKRAVIIVICLMLLTIPMLSCSNSDDASTGLLTKINDATAKAQSAYDLANKKIDQSYVDQKFAAVQAPNLSSYYMRSEADPKFAALDAKIAAMQVTIDALKGTGTGTGTGTTTFTGNNVIPANITFGQFVQLSNPTIGFGPTQNLSSGQVDATHTTVQYGLQIPSITNNSNAQRQIYIQGNFSAQFGNPIDVTAAVPVPFIQNNSWITWSVTHLTPPSSATGPWSWSIQSGYFNVGPGTSTGAMNLTLTPPFANSAQWIQSWIIYVVN